MNLLGKIKLSSVLNQKSVILMSFFNANNFSIKIAFFVASFVFCTYSTGAQLLEGINHRYSNFTVKDGLPSNEVHTITEDNEGYLWFATDHGATQYDGYKFTTFTKDDGLPSVTVLKIYKDYKGRLWMITLDRGICYYENGKIYPYKYNEKLIRSFDKSTIIVFFYVDSQDTIYFANKNASRITKINVSGDIHHIENDWLLKNGYAVYIEMQPNVKFINSHKRDWYKLSRNKDSINSSKKFYISNTYPIPLLGIVEGETIKYQGSTSIYNGSTQLLADYGFLIAATLQNPNTYEAETYVYKGVVNYFFRDKQKRLFLATNKGIKIYEKGILKNTPDQHLLPSENIHYIYKDREGGLWISTLRNGIYYLPPTKIYDFLHNSQLSGSDISAIKVDKDGSLFIGYFDTNLVDHIQNATVSKITYEQTEDLYSKYTTKILNLENRLYFRSNSQGLHILENKKLKPAHIGLTGDAFHIEKLEESLFLHIGKNGLFYEIFDRKKTISLTNPGIPRLKTSASDASGKVWLGSVHGLWGYDHSLKKFQYYGDEHQLLKNRIDIVKISQKKLYLGTKGSGLLIKNGDSILQISENEGLLSNSISALEIDENTLWIGSLRGINKITIHSYKPFQYTLESYTATDNLPSNYINTITVADTLVYIGTNKGISVISKNKLKPNATPPKMLLSKVEINGVDYRQKTAQNLSYVQNNLQIDYMGLSFASAGNVQYKYRLLPMYAEWKHTEQKEIQYTNLAPKRYRFEVYGMNHSGVWSPEPAVFEFRIAPPFWVRWWFLSLEIIIGLLIIYLLFVWRIKAIKRKIEKRALYEKKLNELKSMSLQSKMNPHFIFNSLNSVQNYILKNQKEKANEYLIQFSMLIRLALENSDQHTILLHKELETIRLYVELEKKRLRAHFEYVETIDPQIHIQECILPALLIQPFIENAIWHGRVHSVPQGKITISMQKKEEVLLIEITDNGIGRKAASVFTKDRKKHKSYATRITQNRIQLLGQLHQGLSEIKITDNNPTAKKQVGTKVCFSIPYITYER